MLDFNIKFLEAVIRGAPFRIRIPASPIYERPYMEVELLSLGERGEDRYVRVLRPDRVGSEKMIVSKSTTDALNRVVVKLLKNLRHQFGGLRELLRILGLELQN